jgi:hypothetical protein
LSNLKPEKIKEQEKNNPTQQQDSASQSSQETNDCGGKKD